MRGADRRTLFTTIARWLERSVCRARATMTPGSGRDDDPRRPGDEPQKPPPTPGDEPAPPPVEDPPAERKPPYTVNVDRRFSA